MSGGNKDWIPEGVKEFDDFQKIYCLGVSTNVSGWHITTSKNTVLQNLHDTYDEFYAISKLTTTASKDDYDNTDAARKALKTCIRNLTRQEIKNNTLISNVQRSDIGVPNGPAAPTTAVASNVSPGLTYNRLAECIGKYEFTPKQMPVGQGSYSIKTAFYKIGDTVPTEKQCTKFNVIDTDKTPIVYEAENLGMSFVSYTRYLTTTKILGLAATKYLGIVS